MRNLDNSNVTGNVNHKFTRPELTKTDKILDAVEADFVRLQSDVPGWKKYVIREEPPDEPALIEIVQAQVVYIAASVGNHSLIIGKKKSRKTLFLIWLISLYKDDITTDVIWFDTEQGSKHVWKIFNKVKMLTGKEITILALRGKSPLERRTIISQVINDLPIKPKIVVIDGVRDLLSNINDPDQVSEVITWEEKLIMDYGVHIINVLHQNKTDNNARGHIGSELLNKAEITIELEKDEKANCTIIKCESSRDKPFENFAFTHGPDELPMLLDTPIKGEVISSDERKNRIRFIFSDNGDLLKYGDLVELVKETFEVGTNKAKSMVNEYSRNGWIMKNGRERSKDVVYKCLI